MRPWPEDAIHGEVCPLLESAERLIRVDGGARAIVVRHKNGPFRRLENIWRFVPRGDNASDVDFAIDYEFSSPVLGLLMGAVFDSAFRKFAEAFETRAGVVYGQRASAIPNTTAT